MTSIELRQKFLSFFEEKGHAIIPSSSLIPENDPTVLFTTAGMQPLVPFLLGEKHPAGKRLANVQKCVRTGDIEEVGDPTHHTFLEMLGNWSLGDYFKKESIEWSWEFLTSKKGLSLDKSRLAVSIFEGDNNAPLDDEAREIWLNLGIKPERIKPLPKGDNWWGPAGQTGPCGPDTEIFYWVDNDNPVSTEFNPQDKRWVEIWNNVFMEYNKTKNGKYEVLNQKNVDTGMGLERILSAINGLSDNYMNDIFFPIIEKIEKLSGKKYIDNLKEFRIVADHIKAAVIILGDEKGIVPSNLGQGYVVRRLIRRAIYNAKKIGIKEGFSRQIAEVAIDIYKDVYKELEKNKEFILSELEKEEEKFKEALEKGLKELKKIDSVDAEKVFYLRQTFGLPLEMIKDELVIKGLAIDEKELQEQVKKHQDLSRTASAGMFKGGLADNSEVSARYHTATHLLLAALKQVLGSHVYQKGSNINSERLRFDFFHHQKMTSEEVRKAEDIVNKKIKEDIPVICEEMTLEEAKKRNATGVFDSKYGEKVKVYTINDPSNTSGQVFSKEICGGPHAKRTSELGRFKIIKEESSSSGTRRIRAVLE